MLLNTTKIISTHPLVSKNKPRNADRNAFIMDGYTAIVLHVSHTLPLYVFKQFYLMKMEV